MWKLCFIVLVACLCIEAKGHAKTKHIKAHKTHADNIDDSEFEDDKRDAIAQPYDYSHYQTQYNTAKTSPQAAAYTSSSTYHAPASADSFSATQRAAVAAPQPAAAPAPASAAPAPAPAAAAPAPAAAAPAPAAAPAAPAPAAPAPAPAPAAPAPAPAPAPAAAAPSPAPAAAYPAPAAASASSASSQSRSAFPSSYPQSSSASSSFTYNYPSSAPAAAPAPAPAPAPAYYYRQPSTATATVAAAASQAAKSTLSYTDLKKNSTGKKDACSDDTRADHFCSKAHNPCYCEENHHFMYNYCKRSCSWCEAGTTTGHRFWRIVNSAVLPRSWIIKEIEFYSDKRAKKPLKITPSKAYASTSYPGYLASNAFDGKRDTYWLPEGWYERFPGMDYIGMQFDQPVSIGAVRVIHQSNEKNATSTKMYLESSDFYDNNYYKVFNMENPKKRESKKYSFVSCPIYWRRFDTGEAVYCVKTIAEFLTWQQARDKCATYGADLLSINSPSENMFINNDLRLCGFTWIGLNDKKNESHFSWSDGNEMTFKSWAGDESYYEQDEYLNSKQNCVAASRTGEWRPFHCDDKFYAVCKMKLKAPEDDEEEDMEHYHHTRLSKKSSKGKKQEEDEEDDDDDSSGNTEIEISGDDSDSEDAIKEIKKNVKKAQSAASKSTEDEEDDDDDDDSGSGSDDDSEKSNKHVKANRKEEIEKVDDSFLDLKH